MQKNIDITKLPTPEQIAMLEAASLRKPCIDEDCPEFSEEELKTFHRISAQKKDLRQKQNVTLRLSPQALKKAKSLGKGYTSVLSRILEDALNNAETIQHYL